MGDLILEEVFDDDFELSENDIREYAQWLEIDVSTESALLWIAEKGIKEPLPSDWKPCKTSEGEIYYFNFSTGESIWDHPCDAKYKAIVIEERVRLQQGSSDKHSVSAKAERHDKPTSANAPVPPDEPSEDNHTAPESIQPRRLVSKTETPPETKFKTMPLQAGKRSDKKGLGIY